MEASRPKLITIQMSFQFCDVPAAAKKRASLKVVAKPIGARIVTVSKQQARCPLTLQVAQYDQEKRLVQHPGVPNEVRPGHASGQSTGAWGR